MSDDVLITLSDGAVVRVSPDELRKAIQGVFPAGDPLFQEITWDEQDLYNRKNMDYAGGGEDPNGNFHRAAKIFSLYPGLSLADPRVYAMVQLMKQFDQVLWSLSRGFEGSVEGLEARLADIHVYAKIIRILNRRMAEAEETSETHSKMTNSPVIPSGRESLVGSEVRKHAIALEDLLSRGDAFIENATKVVLELRKSIQTDKS